MESDFEGNVFELIRSNSEKKNAHHVIETIEKFNGDLLPCFVTKYFQVLQNLEQWSWQILSQNDINFHEEPNDLKLLNVLAELNRNLVLHLESIETHLKANLLFPRETIWIDRILERIETIEDENHFWIELVSRWFNNLSLFLRDNSEVDSFAVLRHINFRLEREFLMSKNYMIYLNCLMKHDFSSSTLTKKALFYLKTVSLFLSSYALINNETFSCRKDEIFNNIGITYTDLIISQSYKVDSWSDEFVGCLAHFISFVCTYYWSNGQNLSQIKILFKTDSAAVDFIDGLIRIIVHEAFYPQNVSKRLDDKSILVAETLMTLNKISQNENLHWILRSKVTLPTVLLRIVEQSFCDKICLCIYTILGEILSEENLKAMKIPHHASCFFFNILDQAWRNPRRKYKQIPITFILRSFINLAKVDSVQQTSAETNQLPLLIEMYEEYPIVFEIIWAFSFNKDVQDQLRQNTVFVRNLAHPSRTLNDRQLSKVIHGILWNLDFRFNNQTKSEINDEAYIFDMMISYSHHDESIAKKIHAELTQKGYRVWIDFEQMHGNVMDAMAYGIEHSQTVLISMSDNYRRSNYCRAEAHYAFQRQRKLIPIIVQEHFTPDGWLLFVVGQLLYIDFTENKYHQAIQQLIKQLDFTLKRTNVSETLSTPSTIVQTSASAIAKPVEIDSLEDFEFWPADQIANWLNQKGLVQIAQIFQGFDGLALIYMNESMKHLSLEQMIKLLDQDALRRTNQNLSLVELSQFRAIMDRQRPLKRGEQILEKLDHEKKIFLREDFRNCCHIL